jgi:hypothetical protein
MSKYASKEELTRVARAYCKKMGYEFIFANEYKFGFETKDGGLYTMHFVDLEEKLKELKEEK